MASKYSYDWPEALQKTKYAEFRTEIEGLAELYAKLDENKGVELGLKTAIRNLAQTIIQDEKSGLIDQAESKQVRQFVTNLNRSKGQNQKLMMSIKTAEMLTSKY